MSALLDVREEPNEEVLASERNLFDEEEEPHQMGGKYTRNLPRIIENKQENSTLINGETYEKEKLVRKYLKSNRYIDALRVDAQILNIKLESNENIGAAAVDTAK